MSQAPDVDYRATSARPAWSALPENLRESLSVALGTEITTVDPSVSSGFTGGFAARAHLADGRTVFIKAAPETLHAYGAYQREAEIVPQLPPTVRAPRILATTTSGVEQRWFAVVSEGIAGRMPGMPWTRSDFELVTENCAELANALSPSPLTDLKPFIDDFGEPQYMAIYAPTTSSSTITITPGPSTGTGSPSAPRGSTGSVCSRSPSTTESTR